MIFNFFFLRQVLVVAPRVASNSSFFCLSLLSSWGYTCALHNSYLQDGRHEIRDKAVLGKGAAITLWERGMCVLNCVLVFVFRGECKMVFFSIHQSDRDLV